MDAFESNLRNILLVEDDDSTQLKIENAITSIQTNVVFNVVKTNCCKDALKRVQSERFHLFILDIKLPDGNGVDLARQIRKYSEFPIVFETSVESEKVELNAWRVGGCLTYIRKPLEKQKIVNAIQLMRGMEKVYSRKNYNYIQIQYSNNSYQIDLENVLYIETIGLIGKPSVRIHTYNPKSNAVESRELSNYTLKKIMDGIRLSENETREYLFQCHKSFLVNRIHITKSCYDYVKVKYVSVEIPVGGKYRSNVNRDN